MSAQSMKALGHWLITQGNVARQRTGITAQAGVWARVASTFTQGLATCQLLLRKPSPVMSPGLLSLTQW